MTDEKYMPPKVWTWDQESGGKFANINRPISGATHEKDLPMGKHPMQLYSLGTPNGVKVTVLLEELLALGYEGAEYDAYLINIGNGDQFSSGFVKINPNSNIHEFFYLQSNYKIGASKNNMQQNIKVHKKVMITNNYDNN